MTALAMRSAGAINAVSQLHGEVTREMFAPLWPDLAAERSAGRRDHERRARADVDVGASSAALFERHLSPAWRDQYEDPAFWARILDIPDEDLWAARQRAARVPVPVHPRARARSAGPTTRPAPRASSPAARCSIPTR